MKCEWLRPTLKHFGQQKMAERRLCIAFFFTTCCWSMAKAAGPFQRRPEATPQPAEPIPLYIGGIFPMSADQGGWPGGQACRPAALLALDDVNQRPDLLPGYVLRMIDDDSQCQPGLGAKVMYELLYKPPTKLTLLVGCSLVTTTIAEAASLWNLVVLSYGASSPALSDRHRFPTLFRTHPSATIHNPTRIALFKKFQWSKIAILQSVEELFTSTAEDLERSCKENNITITTRQSFFGDPSDAVKNLKRQDARIIVGLFYEKEARKVFCEVYKEGLYGRKYVWFLIGWYADSWYIPSAEDAINCTAEEMAASAQFHFTTEAIMWNRNGGAGVSKMTAEQFELNLTNSLSTFPNQTGGWVESPLAYDAIWALALALNCTMNNLKKEHGNTVRLEHFGYGRDDIFKEIYNCMNKTRFLGVSGMVMFSSKGDRIAWTLVEQFQNGHYTELGKFDFRSGNLSFDDAKVKFAGKKPPPDSTKIVEAPELVDVGLFWGLGLLAILAIIAAAVCAGFNFYFGDRRIIQQSQPMSNILVLVGCVLCCIGIFLLGIDGRYVQEDDSFAMLCQARVWILCLGFTFSYGTMFSKVWRVHRINSREAPLEQEVQPWKIQVIVFTFILFDVILLTCWASVDPLQRTIEKFDSVFPVDSDEDIKKEPILEHCECKNQNIWIGIFYAYKGILLLFGLFLAYEVRNVKLKHLNDSRFVGMAIYNVVVLCLITGPVSLIISSQPNASFAFVAVAILLCIFLSIALIFLPKVLYIKSVPRSVEARQLTERCMTREDDERYKRLLQENEEIKRAIADKEARIRMLNVRLQERLALVNGPNFTNRLGVAAGEANLPVSASGELRAKSITPAKVLPFTDGAAGKDSENAPASINKTETNGKEVKFNTDAAGVAHAAIVHKEPEDSGYRSSCKSVNLVEPMDTDILL